MEQVPHRTIYNKTKLECDCLFSPSLRVYCYLEAVTQGQPKRDITVRGVGRQFLIGQSILRLVIKIGTCYMELARPESSPWNLESTMWNSKIQDCLGLP